MAKAEFATAAGTKVTIEGTPAELAELTHLFEFRGTPAPTKGGPKRKVAPSDSKPRGVPGYVEELRGAGFFRKAKSLAEVETEMRTRGHTVPKEHLSVVLLRHVRAKKLQRIKDGASYRYGNR